MKSLMKKMLPACLVLSCMSMTANAADIWDEIEQQGFVVGSPMPALTFTVSTNDEYNFDANCETMEMKIWAKTEQPSNPLDGIDRGAWSSLPHMCDDRQANQGEGCASHFQLVGTTTAANTCALNMVSDFTFEEITIPALSAATPNQADIRVAILGYDSNGKVVTVIRPDWPSRIISSDAADGGSGGGSGQDGQVGGPGEATVEELTQLLVTKSDRNVPFNTLVRLSFENKKTIRRVRNVTWYVSSDGGASWDVAKNPNGTPVARPRVAKRLTDRQHLQFRAEFDLDGEHYQTETKDVYALVEPKVRIEGPNVTYSAYPITQTAVITNGVSGDIRWQVFSSKNRKVPILEQDSSSLTLQGLEPGGYIVVANSTENPAFFEGRPGLGRAQQTVVVVATNEVVEPVVKGLRNVKVGKGYSYMAMLPGAFSSARARHDLTLTGSWSLSDGTQQDGPGFTYTPAAAGEVTATFQGYVTQLPEVLVQGSIKLKATDYVWPQWTLTTEATGTQVPVRVMAQAKMANPAAGKVGIGDEVPQYEWTLPEGARVVSQVRNTLIVDLVKPGPQSIGVRVFDTLGNETSLTSDEFDVVDSSPDFQIDALASYMDNNDLAPGKINVRLSVLKVPAKDLFKVFRVKNGETVLAETSQKYVTIPLSQAGDYNLTVEAETKYGVKKQRVLNVPLRPAPAPQCALSLSSETTRVWKVASNCSVSEGSITDLTWTFADKTSSGTTRLMEFRKADFPAGLQVTVQATTNKGLTTTSSITLQAPQ